MSSLLRWLPEDLYYFDYQKKRGLSRALSDNEFARQCDIGNGKQIDNVWHVKVYGDYEEKIGTLQEQGVTLRRSEKMGEDTAEAMEAASAQQRQWAQEKAAASLLRVDIDNPEIDTRFIPKARSDEDGPSRLMTTMQKIS